MTSLQTELTTFHKNKDRLLVEAKDRYVLIKGDEVLGDYGSFDDALSEGYRRFGNSEFLVIRVTEDEVVNSFTRTLDI